MVELSKTELSTVVLWECEFSISFLRLANGLSMTAQYIDRGQLTTFLLQRTTPLTELLRRQTGAYWAPTGKGVPYLRTVTENLRWFGIRWLLDRPWGQISEKRSLKENGRPHPSCLPLVIIGNILMNMAWSLENYSEVKFQNRIKHNAGSLQPKLQSKVHDQGGI